jgi:hypothetical protein
MAILKKKMAGKPAMMKKKKMQEGGVTLAKIPEADPKNALNLAKSDTTNRFNKKTEMMEMNKPLKDVKVKTRGNAFTTAGKEIKRFYKQDLVGADSAKTKTGRVAGKIANTVLKVGLTPQNIGMNLLGAAASPLFKMAGDKITDKDKAEGRLYYSNRKERAAEKAASDSTNAAKRKMGGKVKKYQAGGVVGKQPKAKMVDPKGAYTKVQKRTLAQKKKK